MKPASRLQLPGRALLILAAIALTICAYLTIRRGYAEWLYGGTDNPSRIQRACELEPDDPECALIRAEVTENTADEMTAWEQAARLDPRSAETLTHTAILREMNGDMPGAEQLLLKAESLNHLWLPRWSLANFYLRQQRPADTLKWTRLALRRAYGDRRAAFRLCRQAGASDQAVLNDILDSDEPRNLSAFLSWITEEDRLDVLDQAVPRYLNAALHSEITEGPAPNPALELSNLVETLLQRGHPAEAHDVWKRLLADRLLAVAGATGSEALTNPSFALPALSPPCFDWRTIQNEGVLTQRGVPPDGVRLEFSGRQPENAELLVQPVDLAGSRSWALEYELLARNSSSGKLGLRWMLTPWGGSTAVEPEPSVSSMGTDGWTHESALWRIPDDTRFFRLALMVVRQPGQTRMEGEVQLHRVRLSPVPSREVATP